MDNFKDFAFDMAKTMSAATKDPVAMGSIIPDIICQSCGDVCGNRFYGKDGTWPICRNCFAEINSSQ